MKFIHINTHVAQLKNALNNLSNKIPNTIICHTVKGKGLPFAENNPEWHHKFPNKEELNKMLMELDL